MALGVLPPTPDPEKLARNQFPGKPTLFIPMPPTEARKANQPQGCCGLSVDTGYLIPKCTGTCRNP